MSLRAPAVHSVHIYDNSSSLIVRLCGIVSSALKVGDSVLIVATAEHRDRLVRELLQSGVDVREHARDRRYTMVDAGEMLSTFMRDGVPDRDLFELSVGEMLDLARKSARSRERGLTVFGEMVALLWDEGNKEAALQVEALWNEALNDRAFHLHCAYPRWGFINGDEAAAVCSAHSHVMAA